MKFKNHITRLCVFFSVGILAYVLVSNFQTAIILSISIQFVRALQIGIKIELALVMFYGLYILVLWSRSLRSKLESGKQTRIEDVELQSDPSKWLLKEIQEYIKDNKSTAFFREKLETILIQLPQISKQVENVKKVAVQRFDTGTISYSNNIHPLETLYSNLIRLSNDLIQKLQMFDENKYQSKIAELRASNRLNDVTEYEEVMQHYIDYANDIVAAFEKTSVKLDKLILEFAKLSSEDLQQSIEAIKALDTVITNTKLYK